METDRIAAHATFVDLSSARNYSVPGIGTHWMRKIVRDNGRIEGSPAIRGKTFIFLHDNTDNSACPGISSHRRDAFQFYNPSVEHPVTRILIHSERFEHRNTGNKY